MAILGVMLSQSYTDGQAPGAVEASEGEWLALLLEQEKSQDKRIIFHRGQFFLFHSLKIGRHPRSPFSAYLLLPKMLSSEGTENKNA